MPRIVPVPFCARSDSGAPSSKNATVVAIVPERALGRREMLMVDLRSVGGFTALTTRCSGRRARQTRGDGERGEQRVLAPEIDVRRILHGEEHEPAEGIDPELRS